MAPETLFFLWLISVFCGFLLGMARGQLIAGIVCTFLLGPIGLLVVLCLPNRKKERKKRERRE